MWSTLRMVVLSFVLIVAWPASGNDQADGNTQRLAPTSDWVINYADQSCVLARNFGVGGTLVSLQFEAFQPGNRAHLLLRSKGLEYHRRVRYFRYAYSPVDDRNRRAPGIYGSSEGGETIILGLNIHLPSSHRRSRLPEYDYDYGEEFDVATDSFEVDHGKENAITAFYIEDPLKRPVLLETGPLAEPLNALRGCLVELVSHWGIDVAAHETLSRRVKPKVNPSKWLYVNNRPKKGLDGGVNGLVSYRLIVGTNGKPEGCVVQSDNLTDGLAAEACELLQKNAVFLPALDADGNPIRSYFVSSYWF